MKFKNFFKRNWNAIISNTIVAVLVSLLLFFANSYRVGIEERTSQQIEEQAQEMRIKKCDENISTFKYEQYKLQTKNDSAFIKNNKDHYFMINNFKRIEQKLNNLTFVIISNNKKMQKDLNDIKKSQENYSFYSISNQNVTEEFTEAEE